MRLTLLCLHLALAATRLPRRQSGQPDLVVSRVSVSHHGRARRDVKVELTTKNAGKAKSARSVTSLWLTKQGGALLGRHTVKAVKGGKASAGTLTVKAPRTAGTHTLVACADTGRAVKERSERNNCRTAKLVVRAATPPAPAPQPAPAPAVRAHARSGAAGRRRRPRRGRSLGPAGRRPRGCAVLRHRDDRQRRASPPPAPAPCASTSRPTPSRACRSAGRRRTRRCATC